MNNSQLDQSPTYKNSSLRQQLPPFESPTPHPPQHAPTPHCCSRSSFLLGSRGLSSSCSDRRWHGIGAASPGRRAGGRGLAWVAGRRRRSRCLAHGDRRPTHGLARGSAHPSASLTSSSSLCFSRARPASSWHEHGGSPRHDTARRSPRSAVLGPRPRHKHTTWLGTRVPRALQKPGGCQG